MANPIPAERLRPKQTIVVRGNILFSRVMSMIEGDELARNMERQRQTGMLYTTNVPHTHIAINNARIIPTTQNGLTPEEQHVQNNFYTSKKNPQQGVSYSIDNKSPFLPPVFQPVNPADLAQGYTQITEPGGELDKGVDVTLVLETYETKAYAKKGIGLSAVLVNEEPRYYSSSRIDRDTLAGLGIIIKGNAATPNYSLDAPAEADAQSVQGGQTQAAPSQYTDNQGLPTPGIGAPAPQGQAQPQTQPAQNQYAFPQNQPQVQPQAQSQTQPQVQPAQNQYAFPQAQQNQPQPAPIQPAPAQSAFDPNAVPQAQAQHQADVADPWSTAYNGGQTGGITYNS